MEDERRKLEDLERELHATKSKYEAESAIQKETIDSLKESKDMLSNTEKSLREQLEKTQVFKMSPMSRFAHTVRD